MGEPATRTHRVTGAFVIATLFMGSTLVTPLYELYRARYRLDALMLVLLYAVYVVGNLSALLFFGRLSDQLGRRPIALGGLVLAAASAALFALAAGLPWLFVARAINGLAVGVGVGAATAWITEFTPPDRRVRAASLMTEFNFIGLAAGPILCGVLIQYAPHPLQLPFFAYIVCLAVVAAFALRTPETVKRAASSSSLLRPRLRVPRGLRMAFAAPAAAGFIAMSVVASTPRSARPSSTRPSTSAIAPSAQRSSPGCLPWRRSWWPPRVR